MTIRNITMLQILMSVVNPHTIVMPMQFATTQTATTLVRVQKDTQEMDLHAAVSEVFF